MSPFSLAVPWVAIGALASGLALLALVRVLTRYRGKPGATWFMVSLTMHAVWCLGYGVGLFVFDPRMRAALEVISWLGFSWIGFFFLGFALDYTGRNHLTRSAGFRGLAVVPSATTALLVTTPLHGFLWREFRVIPTLGVAAAEYTLQPWAYVLIGAGLLFASIGVLLLLETVISYGPLYRREAAAVALSPVPVTAGLLVWVFELGPAPLVNWGVVLSILHAALDAYAFVGSGMFVTNPTTRRAAEKSALESLPNPVFIVDPNHRVVDLNARAETVFDTTTEAAVERPFGAVTGVELDRSATEVERSVRLQPRDRVRQYDLAMTPLGGPTDRHPGYEVVLQDVTEERERRQRLEVLNRVLRHNLRNDMNTIVGYTEQIEDRTDDETVQQFSEIVTARGERLLETGAKVREFDRVRESSGEFERVDVAALVADVVGEQASAHPEATITREGSAKPVYSNADLLRLALSNLVENAVVHGGDAPAVTVTLSEATAEGESLDVEIRDDGPGIPPHEIRPVLDGDEDDLVHGSGLGLWITRWCLTSIGGDLSFETSDAGTLVTVSLPCDPEQEFAD